MKIRDIDNSGGAFVDASDVQMVHCILELEESDIFKGMEGNVLVIEDRGKQIKDDILFKIDDVSEAFELPDKTLLHKNGAYEEGVHHKRSIL